MRLFVGIVALYSKAVALKGGGVLVRLQRGQQVAEDLCGVGEIVEEYIRGVGVEFSGGTVRPDAGFVDQSPWDSPSASWRTSHAP